MFSVVESTTPQQFVHLRKKTAGLVTITGAGKKTLQSHQNNDSNSEQDRCWPLQAFSLSSSLT